MNYKEYTVIVYADGTKHWCLDGQLHRENGPAVEKTNGHKEWWIKGQLHREDGPAIEWDSGWKSYFLNNKEMSERKWNRRVAKIKKTLNKIVEIEGRKYKLIEVNQ